MKELLEHTRKQKKPALLECLTYRLSGHSSHDNRPYRSEKEINEWKAKDPLRIVQGILLIMA